jgi:hypothetical protein
MYDLLVISKKKKGNKRMLGNFESVHDSFNVGRPCT